MKKKCPDGKYYCYTDKVCKDIPKGFKVVGPAGMLRKENGHTVDDDDSETNGNGKKNGNGNGNGASMSEGSLRDWFGKSKSKDGKPGWVQSDGSPCANEPGETKTPKCYSSAKRASMTKKELRSADARKSRQDPGQQQKSGAAKPTYVSTDKPKKKMKEEMEVNEAKDKPGKGSGTKDACYHKVKSRYSVWPSAYASGALVKCRRAGAKNWGNSTKKEEFMALPEFSDIQINAMRNAGIEVEVFDEACWKGYEKKGMKTMFGKRYPNCVKKTKKEEIEHFFEKKSCNHTHEGKECPEHGMKECPSEKIDEAVRVPAKTGNLYLVSFTWKGKYMMMKIFFPEVSRPTRTEVQDALEKVYPGCKVSRFDMTPYQPGEPMLTMGEEVEDLEEIAPIIAGAAKVAAVAAKGVAGAAKTAAKASVPVAKKVGSGVAKTVQGGVEAVNAAGRQAGQERAVQKVKSKLNMEGAAWTKKAGKNKEGGLNEKGRKSYERENPGSDLKAPSKKVGNPRRKSFCARMKGMKKKLTSAKTARDPDSRINKSLRAWNC